eukprot:TRINITY_DN1269_c0_g1_i13.p2 TRINITY_DN1269_c0_g1~~TRINITY_DN1269_c0_g1_i13.p2  ORF type:complete len:110 (-),score=8.14 TRINITY_DN1269_c0_g1_i13:112-441(-)
MEKMYRNTRSSGDVLLSKQVTLCFIHFWRAGRIKYSSTEKSGSQGRDAKISAHHYKHNDADTQTLANTNRHTVGGLKERGSSVHVLPYSALIPLLQCFREINPQKYKIL